MLDIYTLKPIALPSAEHILQDALGGRLKSRELIDKTTNDFFGGTIDADIAQRPASGSHRCSMLGVGRQPEPAPPLERVLRSRRR